MNKYINATDKYIDGEYFKNNLNWHAEDAAWKAKQIEGILKKNKIDPKTVVEIGCGSGEILRQLSNIFTKANFIGYEISPQAFEMCRKIESEQIKFINNQLPINCMNIDCLLCIDVFEHVEDYIGFIKSLKKTAN